MLAPPVPQKSNAEYSMMGDTTIRQDSAGITLYVRFNHNVASEQLKENNLSKLSVIANDGRPAAANVWVKDTQLEFQYRQYIFITLAENLDPAKGYQIVVAPGVRANNTYVDEAGNNLFFSYAGTAGDAGAGGSESAAEEENFSACGRIWKKMPPEQRR